MMNLKTSATAIRAQRSPLPKRLNQPAEQSLTFSPLAWLKLRLFLHADDVEVAGFGISAEDDLLYVEDFVSVRQFVSAITVELEDAAVADHFDRYADDGIPPSRCGRIWIHTHPGTSPHPSGTDETTFQRVFGHCDWAIMAILARGGDSYARLRFSAGPGGSSLLPVAVDWERFPMELSEKEAQLTDIFGGWMDEYGKNVCPRPLFDFADTDGIAKAAAEIGLSPLNDLDFLYDQQVLADSFFDVVDDPTEVYPWR